MRVLCLDIGSSSVKSAIYILDDREERRAFAGETSSEGAQSLAAQLESVFAQAIEVCGGSIDAIGHRIVFGADRFTGPTIAADGVLRELDSLVALDPLHLGPQLEAVRVAGTRFPKTPQVLCFDTAFHRRMPDVARRYPLPPSLGPQLQRYGFHGLSYEFVLSALQDARRGKVIVAHLGSGASMCAIADGRSVDTTMGFSPLGGLMMGSRPGDLDPGAMLFLLDRGWNHQALVDLFYKRSGIAAVSETTSDVRTLLSLEATDPRARLAIEMFVYQARKHLGGLIAVLGGLDLLVFTGGIGQHSPEIRLRICEPFTFAGIAIDRERNDKNEQIISNESSGARVRAIETNENVMIARHTYAALRQANTNIKGV